MNTPIECLDWIENNPEPSREMDGRIMFTLFAEPRNHGFFLWPTSDNPQWVFANIFTKRPSPNDRNDSIFWQLDDGNYLWMNDLRVPKGLSSDPYVAINLIKYFFGVETFSINMVDAVFDIVHDNELIRTQGPTPALAVIRGLLILRNKLLGQE